MEVLLWFIGLAIAIVFAVVCYRVAEGKGRSGVLYGLLGFFLPVIGLIVALVVPDRRA
jgi:hypothetical protein